LFASSSVDPTDNNMMIVLQEILNDNLDFVRNSNGEVLRKIGPNWVNGIGDWSVTEGYLFKMNATETLVIEGEQLNAQTPINLVTGYQFVSYLPLNAMDAMDAFAEIIGDDLDFIRNSNGEILRKIGPNWINGIGDWISTEGYLFKLEGPETFALEGDQLPPDTPISLPAGFRFVSFLPISSIDAMTAFASIIGDDLLYIRNSQGGMLRKIGPNWINGIGDANPGEGYLVKMLNPGV